MFEHNETIFLWGISSPELIGQDYVGWECTFGLYQHQNCHVIQSCTKNAVSDITD